MAYDHVYPLTRRSSLVAKKYHKGNKNIYIFFLHNFGQITNKRKKLHQKMRRGVSFTVMLSIKRITITFIIKDNNEHKNMNNKVDFLNLFIVFVVYINEYSVLL